MIEAIITGAACGIIGMASGQALVLSAGRRRLAWRCTILEEQATKLTARVHGLEQTLPDLISRSEVENAFAQAAQIEAQRQAQAMQQARAAAAFGGNGNGRGEMNTAINSQLEALSARINRINQEFGVQP